MVFHQLWEGCCLNLYDFLRFIDRACMLQHKQGLNFKPTKSSVLAVLLLALAGGNGIKMKLNEQSIMPSWNDDARARGDDWLERQICGCVN